MPVEQRVDLQGDRLVQHNSLLQIAGVAANLIQKGIVVDLSEDTIPNELHVVKPIRHNRPRYVQTT